MSDYPYRAYSPSTSNPNRSPTRRTPNPSGGSYPADWNRNVHSMPGFEGWKAEEGNDPYASSPKIVPEVVPKAGAAASDPFLIPQSSSSYGGVPPSLQPGSRDSISGSVRTSFKQDAEFDLAFGTGPSGKRSSYSTATSGSESPFRRRHVRTPSESSTESASRSRDRRPSRQNRDRTPSTSPSRAIPRDGVATTSSTLRTPSGNLMSSIFNAENAAAVGNVLGSAASFIGSRAGIIKPEEPPRQEYDDIPGGFNNRPVPDTAGNNNNAFNIGDAMNYLSSHLSAPQTPAPPPPAPSQQQGGSPFTIGNALNYLQHATQGQTATTPGNNGIPQNFQLAGIDIDLKWIAQKASEQNPWVLLGGAVVSFWIISSIIATLIWYGIVAGILYVIYIVGVKNGGFQAISGGSSPPRRRISTPGNTGGGSWSNTGRAPGGGTEWRRRY
ncbi:hypothetical protein TWF281_006559 [Arthrobotrys megalospora]